MTRKIEVARGTYIPHFDESGQVLGFFLLYVDITERRQAEAALRNANEGLERRVATRTAELEAARARAEDANIDKTRFIAAASHDLLQPLHAARLFVAALSERHVADELVAKVDLGLSSVEALLDALLDIAKLDAGAIKPEPRSIPLGPLLQSLGRCLRALGRAERHRAAHRPQPCLGDDRSGTSAPRAAELSLQRHPLWPRRRHDGRAC